MNKNNDPPLFQIRDLIRCYPENNCQIDCDEEKRKECDRVVLNVKKLDIPRGKLVVILGNSGCGKTTFLETLGLMNHKPNHSDEIKFYPEAGTYRLTDKSLNKLSKKIEDKSVIKKMHNLIDKDYQTEKQFLSDLEDEIGFEALNLYKSDILEHSRAFKNYFELWGNKERLAQIRREHFSFIFQHTNMLPKFYVEENISLTSMIQGKNFEEARDIAHIQMEKVDILDKKGARFHYQLSGGQQQRAAFARAVAPKFTVLFGDEPTGNLGEQDARQVLGTIQEYINSTRRLKKEKLEEIIKKFLTNHQLTEQSLKELKKEPLPENILKKLETLKDEEYSTEGKFLSALENLIGKVKTESYKSLILKHAKFSEQKKMIEETLFESNSISEVLKKFSTKFIVNDESLKDLEKNELDDTAIKKLETIKNIEFNDKTLFIEKLEKVIGRKKLNIYEDTILKYSKFDQHRDSGIIVNYIKLLQIADEFGKVLDEINQSHKHTAIIVTHTIDLALDFADQIIVIPEDGVIRPQYVFNSKIVDNDGFEEREWPGLASDYIYILRRTELIKLREQKIPNKLLKKLSELRNQPFTKEEFLARLEKICEEEGFSNYKSAILNQAEKKQQRLNDKKLLCNHRLRRIMNIGEEEDDTAEDSPQENLKENNIKEKLNNFKSKVKLNVSRLYQSRNLLIDLILDLMPSAIKNKAEEDKNGAIKKDFLDIFSKKEGQEFNLFSQNGFILIGILFFVLCAVGFAKGSLSYLDYKMNDPFVKWIDVEIPYNKTGEIENIRDVLTSSVNQHLSINSVNGYYNYVLFIRKDEDSKKRTFPIPGRTIQINDPLLDQITNSDNLIKGRKFDSERDKGLLVTERFLKEYAISDKDLFVNMSFENEYIDEIVPVPIRGIVEDLPGKSMFASTQFFKDQLHLADPKPYNPENTKELKIFMKGDDKEKAWELYNSLSEFLEEKYKELDPFPGNPEPYNETYESGYVIFCSFYPEPQLKKLQKIFNQFKNSPQGEKYELTHLYDHSFSEMRPTTRYDRLSINVENLDAIEELKNFMLKEFELKIDMARIESLKNYNFVAKLTQTLSFMMIIISITGVCTFIGYILYLHLYKMRVFIGSFKAFGISDNTLKMVYLKMMIKFVLKSILVSILLSGFIGYSTMLRTLLLLERDSIYFDLFNFYTLSLILFVFISSFIILVLTADSILENTPGDLIYGREYNNSSNQNNYITVKNIETAI